MTTDKFDNTELRPKTLIRIYDFMTIDFKLSFSLEFSPFYRGSFNFFMVMGIKIIFYGGGLFI